MNHYHAVKRGLDIVFSVAGLILLGPVIFALAVANCFFTGFSPFFFQCRIGKHGKPFVLVKFTTMKPGMSGTWNTGKNDPRITSFGMLMRKTSVDELPQFFNILLGEMSFIGPRPDLKRQIEILEKREMEKRLSVRPGLTGLAQVSGRSSLTPKKRLEYDIEYTQKLSFWMDVSIALKTLAVILDSKTSN